MFWGWINLFQTNACEYCNEYLGSITFLENFILATPLNILHTHAAQSLVTTTLTQPIQHCAILIQSRKFSLSTPWKLIAIGVQLHSFLTSAVDASSQIQKPIALFPQKNTGTHLRLGWLDSWTCLAVLEKRKSLSPCQGSKLGLSSP
jgi:hypothetical protein